MPRNPSGYHQTIAELETTTTPNIERFPRYEEYSEVIHCTHTTLREIIAAELRGDSK